MSNDIIVNVQLPQGSNSKPAFDMSHIAAAPPTIDEAGDMSFLINTDAPSAAMPPHLTEDDLTPSVSEDLPPPPETNENNDIFASENKMQPAAPPSFDGDLVGDHDVEEDVADDIIDAPQPPEA